MESLKEAVGAQFEKAVSDIRALANGSEQKMEAISQFVEMDHQVKVLRKNSSGETRSSETIQGELDSLRFKVEYIKSHLEGSQPGEMSSESPAR